MKKGLFFSIVFGMLCSLNIASQNLIQGGGMEAADRTYWSELGGVSTGTNSQLVWGDLPDAGRSKSYKPAGFNSGGFLTVCEDWSANVQYCIYQAVTLVANTTYIVSFDRHIESSQRAWLDVYMGKTQPIAADYSDNKLGSIISWNTASSSPKNTSNYKVNFTPAESGVYYLAIKWGCGAGGNGYFNTAIDNVSVEMAPTQADFSLKYAYTMGFAGIPVTFENKSSNGTSYAWDFDNGTTSTQKDPAAVTYATPGTYTVTLTLDGNPAIQASQEITILPAPNLSAQEKVLDGDMEDAAKWFTATYNSGTNTPVFSLNWNYSKADNPVNFPTGGSGNALVIKDDTGNGAGVFTRFTYIYQPVYLVAGKVYKLDMAARSIRMANTGTLWAEAYVLKEQPINGKALSVTNALSPAYYNGAAAGYDTPATTWDVVFSTDSRVIKGASYAGDKCIFVPDETGIYFYIVRVGTNNKLEVAIDNLSLKEIIPDPVPSFKIKVTDTGDAPFSVEFENTSLHTTSYAWDFGDAKSASNTSTDENPTHVYNKAGIYTVTLVANGDPAKTYSKKLYVTAENNLLNGGNMESAAPWTVTHMDYAAGKSEATMTWNYTGNIPQNGAGGALRISTTEAYRVIIGLSQSVTLEAGKSYKFNMALKTLIAMNASFWSECYFLQDVTPVATKKLGIAADGSGKEYVKETVAATPSSQIGGFCSGFINHDANYNGSLPANWDVKFSDVGFMELNSSASKQPSKVDVGVFTPTVSGAYNFILKIGTQNQMDVVFDELSVKALFAGNGPTENQSVNAEKALVCADNGVITVKTGIQTSVVSIYTSAGVLVQSASFAGQFASDILSSGLYIVKVNGESHKVLVK